MQRLLRASSSLLAVFVATCAPAAPSWQAAQHDLPSGLLSVWGTSSHDVYAVGGDTGHGHGPQVLHFDGARWQSLATGASSGDLWWVAGIGADTVFMVGTGGLALRYVPSTGAFDTMSTPSATTTLFGVWGLATTDVWAVGVASTDTGERTGVLWHYDGSMWEDRTTALGTSASLGAVFKVWGRASDDAWIVGESGLSAHWDGANWSAVATDATHPRLLTVHGDGSHRFAVGGAGTGVVLEDDGAGGWRTASAPTDLPQLDGVYVPANGAAHAVGISGVVVQRGDDGWHPMTAQPDTGGLDFHSVWIDERGGIWAAGGLIVTAPTTRGMVWHYGSPVPTGG